MIAILNLMQRTEPEMIGSPVGSAEAARVVRIDATRGVVYVSMEQTDSCGGCALHKVCHPSDREAVVPVVTPDAACFQPGQKVKVMVSERQHRGAIMLLTVLPCLVLVASMPAVYLLTGSQPVAALSGVGLTALFYALLWACRKQLQKKYYFTILKTSDTEII